MYDVFTQPYCHAETLQEQIVRDRTSLWRDGLRHQLILLATLVLCSLVIVWARVEVFQVGYQISEANKLYQERIRENQRLLVEVSSLRSPSRIEAIATKQLGFVHPKQDHIVVIP